MDECEVLENCKNYGKCDICNNYELYWMIKTGKKYWCKRQTENSEKKKIQHKMQKDSEASKRGKKSKRKGYTGEHELVKLLEKLGIESKRVPLSGALKGENLSGDLHIVLDGERRTVEVKRRASGHKTLYKYIAQDNADYVMLRDDNQEWLVLSTLKRWVVDR